MPARGSLDLIDLLVNPQTSNDTDERDNPTCNPSGHIITRFINRRDSSITAATEPVLGGREIIDGNDHFITGILRSTSIGPEPTNEQSFESVDLLVNPQTSNATDERDNPTGNPSGHFITRFVNRRDSSITAAPEPVLGGREIIDGNEPTNKQL
jgi:hypothetical protein